MAGKGRGVAAFTFNIEALGIGRGSMPEARVGPSPLFPNTDFKPVPLRAGEDEDYMLALKQELRGTMQRLPHNIKIQSNKADVEKYTEKYLKQRQMEDDEWTPDWNLFPKELMPQKKKPRPKAGMKTKTKKTRKDTEDMLSKLDELAKKDDGNPEKSDDETEKKTGKNENEEEEIEEEEYDDEDIEEENDYIESYFDNGEDFAADSDDNMDGEATY
ncbi:DNA-directed RNA polymerase III subunit RPC7 isoform X1 [Mastacembelus armatus]|uniref:Polymerase (RNA) III (DNA directed) polypeptide G n=1 Tax=Mastacembelus armatus TaxID=205130 RepID=A0A7N8Y710_9TELE|nr:DNA-directed RNA polymerase III subunit RPC7 isoform X1 [Mastacembelus armatus]XP_026176953.1 DNA-directed RNA polymerase III subunit RPC7 isoform X1 [Mastacembelus armatus]XP_026176954.1 DNA-directed RNA polymerase III subunit RPC7 isoform X1 [Mastacembelus armatus]